MILNAGQTVKTAENVGFFRNLNHVQLYPNRKLIRKRIQWQSSIMLLNFFADIKFSKWCWLFQIIQFNITCQSIRSSTAHIVDQHTTLYDDDVRFSVDRFRTNRGTNGTCKGHLGEDCNEFLLDTFQTGTEGPYSVSDLHIARFCNSIICLLFRNVFSSHYL